MARRWAKMTSPASTLRPGSILQLALTTLPRLMWAPSPTVTSWSMMAPLFTSTPLPSTVRLFTTARCMTKLPAPLTTEGLTTAEGWMMVGTTKPASSSFSTQSTRSLLLPKAATAQGYSSFRLA